MVCETKLPSLSLGLNVVQILLEVMGSPHHVLET
jgi:hypothetical protein